VLIYGLGRGLKIFQLGFRSITFFCGQSDPTTQSQVANPAELQIFEILHFTLVKKTWSLFSISNFTQSLIMLILAKFNVAQNSPNSLNHNCWGHSQTFWAVKINLCKKWFRRFISCLQPHTCHRSHFIPEARLTHWDQTGSSFSWLNPRKQSELNWSPLLS